MPEMPEPLITPALDEVHQQEEIPEAVERAVPVHVDGPVTVQALPSRVAVMKTINVDVTAQVLVGKDNRRSAITIVTHDQPLWIALSQSNANARDGMLLPIDVPFVVKSTVAIWARTETGTSAVAFMVEQWAD